MSAYDMSIHTNPSAVAWAKFYTECRNRSPDPATFDDEDNMVGWFSSGVQQ